MVRHGWTRENITWILIWDPFLKVCALGMDYSGVLLPKASLSPKNDTPVPSPASILTADVFPSPISDFTPLLGD